MKLSTISIICTVFAIVFIYLFVNTYGRKLLGYFMNSQKLLPVHNEKIESDGSYTNVIFLHHSTGRNLIEEGKIRQMLTEKGYSFWDHDYNFIGLTRPNDSKTKTCYDIPDDTLGTRGSGNTDPEGLAILFKQPVNSAPDNAFSRLLQHEVVIFKSCFPNSAIKNEQMLEQYKKWFLEIRDVIDKHPDKIFIPFTLPPLHPLKTNPEEAKRARAWANWLKSTDFLDGHPNICVCDFFDYLADSSSNMLKKEFQRNPNKGDSHPNELANRKIAPIFVEYIDNYIKSYKEIRD